MEGKKGYKFDTLDIIPYWFDPAARVFHLSREDFTSACEWWVVDQWGVREYGTPAGWDWEALGRRYPDGSWDDRHGTLPRVEPPENYLAFHAMQCVMGELVASVPVNVHPYHYSEGAIDCPWEGWLKSFIPTGLHYWRSDLRSLTPLAAELWRESKDFERWIASDAQDDFRRVSEPVPDSGEWTLVHASIDLYSEHILADSSVAAALVSPATAMSLLRALQAAEPHSWQLPIEGWPGEDAESSGEDFRLEPLLIDRRYAEGYDHLVLQPHLPGKIASGEECYA